MKNFAKTRSYHDRHARLRSGIIYGPVRNVQGGAVIKINAMNLDSAVGTVGGSLSGIH